MAHEFTKYHKIGGAYHWDPVKAGPDYLRHAQNVAGWIQEGPVVDVGGGDGYICSRIRATGKECIVVDNLPYAIELASEKGQPAVLGDIMNLPRLITHRQWGAFYLGDIIEHVDDPEGAINHCGQYTDTIYIATPPADPQKGFMSQYHVTEFSQRGLEAFMDKLGWLQSWSIVENQRIFARYVR